MKRQVSIEEISDGRFYDRRDMVRVGCGGCRGCSACCHGMGNSVILDPLDLHRLSQGLGLPPSVLLEDKIELNVVDGVILPNLKMGGVSEACGFLDEAGRCSVHPFRPGICRLFPLGRYYEEEDAGLAAEKAIPGKKSFRYFIQVNECPAPNKTKVRIDRWLDTPELIRYEAYILQWHNLLELAQEQAAHAADDTAIRNISLYILKLFYLRPYDPAADFYDQFRIRLEQATEILS